MSRTAWTALAALLVAGPALADVDVEVRSGDKVSGTIDPAAETETLRFTIPGGAKVKAKAAGSKRGPAVAVALRDGGDAARGTPKLRGKGGSVAVATAAADTGTWALVVTAAAGGTGDYAASVSWTSPKKFGGKVTLAEGGEGTFAFAADVGAKVRVSASSKGGALPRIVSVEGPSGALDGVDDGAGGRKDATPKLTIPVTGDHVVTVRDEGAGGDVTLTVVVTPPKPSKRKVDVRSAALGGGDGEAYARVLGPEGGTVEVPDLDEGSLDDIGGSGITVPAGVLPSGVALLVGTAPPLDVDGLEEAPLGPTVLFAPEGTVFASKVTVTIPVDLSQVGGDPSRVRVFVRAANGQVSEVTLTAPDAFDFSRPGFVSFPVSHFSAYRCVTTTTAQGFNPFTMQTVSQARCLAQALSSQEQDAVFYVGTDDGRVVAVTTSGTGGGGFSQVTYAGGGASTADDTDRLSFDFQGAVTAIFSNIDGDLFVGTPTRLFVVGTDGKVKRVAGTGASGDGGDLGPATAAQFRSCVAVLGALGGEIWFCDNASGRVRRIDSFGNIDTEFGTGTLAVGTDGGSPQFSPLLDPAALTFDPNGGFFVCDGGRVRRLNRAGPGVNQTFAGGQDGSVGSSGDGGPRLSARFRRLNAIMAEQNGPSITGLLVSDEGAHTIRRIAVDEDRVDTVVGVHDVSGASPDGATAPFPIDAPRGVLALGPNVTFLEADGRVRFYITGTVAGGN